MENTVPAQPANATRVILTLDRAESRMDNVLLQTIREQSETNDSLKKVSRSELKKLFLDGKVQIKGQSARPSSALAKGVTYVDILGL